MINFAIHLLFLLLSRILKKNYVDAVYYKIKSTGTVIDHYTIQS